MEAIEEDNGNKESVYKIQQNSKNDSEQLYEEYENDFEADIERTQLAKKTSKT